MNKLDPLVRKSGWSSEEESTFVRAHRMYGNKWAEISKIMIGR